MKYISRVNHYFLIYFLVSLSGILLMMRERNYLIVYFIYILTLSFVVKISKHNLRKFIVIISVAITITILQFIQFDAFLINSLYSIIIVFAIGYLVIELLKDKFINYFIRLIYFFSIVSLVFYSIGVLNPGLFSNLGSLVDSLKIDPHYTKNILFYNFYDAKTSVFGVSILRNSGFLYEPGMFACVLIPALAINTIVRGTMFNKHNNVFIITILTTFSTAAYLALAAYIIIYSMLFLEFSIKRTVLISAIVILGAGTFWQLDFMGDKILDQYEHAHHGLYSQRHMGRIGSALVDMEEIKRYPLIGRGRHVETRFDELDVYYNPQFTHRVNGIFSLVASMGIPFFIFYLIMLYKSISELCKSYNRKHYAWLLFLVPYLIMASSQTILLRPFFLSLLFLYPFKQNTIK